MTLEEKYQIAVAALQEIARRGREGSGPCYDYLSGDYYSGYDAGLSSLGQDAEDALDTLVEKVEK